MKKINVFYKHLLTWGAIAVISCSLNAKSIYGQKYTEPNITFYVEDVAKEITINVGGEDGTKFTIDWGDGTPIEYEGAKTIKHKPISSEIKIYGEELMVFKAISQGITSIKFGTNPIFDKLQVDRNNLTSLNVTNLPTLKGLYCSENKIEGELELSQCSKMTSFNISRNKISGKIDLSQMNNLSSAILFNNLVDELILPNSELLTSFDCDSNQIKTLNVSNLLELSELNCGYNKLTSLDISKNTKLNKIYCPGNQLQKLNLTTNKQLTGVTAFENKLTSINISACTELTSLFLQDNLLETLNINNNTKIQWANLSNNQLSGEWSFEKQPLLVQLRISGNQITQLDIQNNSKISVLFVDRNKLTNIDVSKQKNLSWLVCHDNEIAELDFNQNTYLYWLECHNNKLNSLDLSKQSYLQKLFCHNNNLSTLDVSNNPGLQSLYIHKNKMETAVLDSIIEALSDVSDLEVHENNKDWIKQLNISENPGALTCNIQIARNKGWIIINNTATNDLISDESAITFAREGSILQCKKMMEHILIYSANGILVASLSNRDEYNIDYLTKGIYIAIGQDINGKTHTLKFCK